MAAEQEDDLARAVGALAADRGRGGYRRAVRGRDYPADDRGEGDASSWAVRCADGLG